ncbi:hypothetical protein [Parabacteroides faecis]|uniref:hypothetical protein n=1 Tax=Parabacteroides faecis TaxID=1217282 RepID=UPI0021668513|nr:hypothetical protein [Parabacteroides faecis]MCS2894312.1 hypothetical protein [Parabacteroides faecis]
MMGEEDRNPEIIRRVDEQLSNVRKEQRVMRLWGGVILGANLLLLGGFLWMLSQGAKQPVPAETGFQFPHTCHACRRRQRRLDSRYRSERQEQH